MEEQTLRDEIRNLISRNRTEKAFELLSSIQFSQVDKQLIVLNSQYNRIKEELRLNVISKGEGEIRINQINMALLDISNKMDSSKTHATESKNITPQKQSFNPKLLLFLLIPIVAFLIYWGITGNDNAPKVPVESSQVLADGKKDKNETDIKEPSSETDPIIEKPKTPEPKVIPAIDILKLNSLVAYYPLDGSGIDKRNGINATATIGVKSQEGRNKKSNGSFYFDGKESRIELPVLLNSQSNNLSISVWIKTLNETGTIWGQYTKSATKYIGNNYSVTLLKKSIIHDNYPPSGGSAKLHEVASNNIPLNVWTHIVITRNSSSIKLYINGKQIADRPETETFETKDWGDVAYSVIGVRPRKDGIQNKDSFNGWIDDLLVFKSAIDTKTVEELYKFEYKY